LHAPSFGQNFVYHLIARNVSRVVSRQEHSIKFLLASLPFSQLLLELSIPLLCMQIDFFGHSQSFRAPVNNELLLLLVAFLPRGRHHCHELFQIFMFNSSWLMH
jgi:hypothetical protein